MRRKRAGVDAQEGRRREGKVGVEGRKAKWRRSGKAQSI
jgi:hypothetical protein